ncbi:unnamed protein product, partial [Phaeothamnion confervicola]
HISRYDLNLPITTAPTDWLPRSARPVLLLEIDGAEVSMAAGHLGDSSRWDTSKVAVLDGIVDEDLRTALLDLITEPGWDHRRGPPETKWERCLIDIPGASAAPSWGLKADALAALCTNGAAEPAPLIEVQSRLAKLFPEATISRMPEAVLGADTTPLVANAPTNSEHFGWHTDCDPKQLPPSPWCDVFGRHTNRDPGKPLFVTLLVYLNDRWPREWDAETLFLDPVSETGVFVRPAPGRVVLMDQDVTHRISAPSVLAGGRPRYSLVWKLVFHSKVDKSEGPAVMAAAAAAAGGSGIASILRPEWGRPTRLGSAS